MDMVPNQPPRTFTSDEANALLPAVRSLIEQLQALQYSIIQTNQQLNDLVMKVSVGNGYPIRMLRQQIQQTTTHQLQLIEAFQSAFNQLERLGCVLKDLTTGLVDFHSLRNGELVCLCWKLGEDRIQFWHTLSDGYPGRQPL